MRAQGIVGAETADRKRRCVVASMTTGPPSLREVLWLQWNLTHRRVKRHNHATEISNEEGRKSN